MHPLESFGGEVLLGNKMEQLAVELEERAEESVAQLLGGGRLLLQRLGEVAITSLQLVEESNVLDGDDRLVGKGLEELDLALRERPFGLRHDDGTDSLALAQHRHDQQRLIALSDRQLTRGGGHR